MADRGHGHRSRTLGGELTGPSPVDRRKLGTKRSIITDGHGLPLGLILAAANEPDNTLAEDTLDSVLTERPEPTAEAPQNFCADKAYDDKKVRQAGTDRHYIVHIRPHRPSKAMKDAEAQQAAEPRHPPRRWVIERTNSWHNRYRKLKTRYEKYAENYVGLVEFACCLIVYRQMLN
jgi:putative transposase